MKSWMAAVLVLWGTPVLWASETPATITSDELELQNNGEVTIFRGHVILKQEAYEIRAHQMKRLKNTGNVEASGQVVGTWISAKQDKVRVESDEALYRPASDTVDLWGRKPVEVHLFGQKDQAHFQGERGWISTKTPGKARLTGQVTGHVNPG